MTTTPTDNKKCPKCGEWKQNHDDEKCWLRYETENGVSHLVGGGDIFDPENPPLKCQVINVSATPADKGPYEDVTAMDYEGPNATYEWITKDGKDTMIGPGGPFENGTKTSEVASKCFEAGRASRDSEVDEATRKGKELCQLVGGMCIEVPEALAYLKKYNLEKYAALTQKETKI